MHTGFGFFNDLHITFRHVHISLGRKHTFSFQFLMQFEVQFLKLFFSQTQKYKSFIFFMSTESISTFGFKKLHHNWIKNFHKYCMCDSSLRVALHAFSIRYSYVDVIQLLNPEWQIVATMCFKNETIFTKDTSVAIILFHSFLMSCCRAISKGFLYMWTYFCCIWHVPAGRCGADQRRILHSCQSYTIFLQDVLWELMLRWALHVCVFSLTEINMVSGLERCDCAIENFIIENGLFL